MKGIISQILFALVALSSWCSSMGQTFETNVASSYFADFRERLTAATEKRELAAIRSLYQTNGVSDSELNAELVRWRPLFDTKTSVNFGSLWFKDLNKAWSEWKNQAGAVTTHECTHLVFLRWQAADGQGTVMLPLKLFEDRLLIVPSDKVRGQLGPSRANSEPVRAETSSPPPAAGDSGR
jgi:hypothetical protein